MKRVAGVFVVLLTLLLGVPFLIPTGTYLRQIEQVAVEKIGQPVTIESLHFALLPTPRANIGNLRIGRHDEVVIEAIAVVPQLGSLLSDHIVISSVVLNRPQLKKAAFDFVGAMPKSQSPSSSNRVVLQHFQVREAKIEWPGINLPIMHLAAEFAADQQLTSARLTSADGRLSLDATPQGDAYALQLDAHEWMLPAGLPLMFNTLKSSMVLQGDALNIQAFDAQLYRGTLKANASLDWRKGLRADGKFSTQGIEVGEVARLFSKTDLVSGRITGDGAFSTNARTASAAADQLLLDYRFNVAQGVLHGVDLAKAATLLLRAGDKGGETQFDTLTGTLHMAGKQIELKNFKVVSGLLEANGAVRVTSAKQLDGKVDVELKKGVALVSVPLQVSGTVDHPVVLPTKAALAGAAVGTGVLGPGVGTSLGVKAASGLEKIKGLFGSP